MAQMRLMMEEVLDQKLTAQSSQLSFSFQASLDLEESDLAAESVERKAEQNKIVEKLAVLETSNSSQAAGAFQNNGNSRQDLCLVLLEALALFCAKKFLLKLNQHCIVLQVSLNSSSRRVPKI